MNCKIEKTDNANEVKLEITVEASKFQDAMKKVYFKSAKYFNIPGFRKGKAPMNIVEKYYGKEIFYEDAFNEVASESYEEALKENKIERKYKQIINKVSINGMDKITIFMYCTQTLPRGKLIYIKEATYSVNCYLADNCFIYFFQKGKEKK